MGEGAVGGDVGEDRVRLEIVGAAADWRIGRNGIGRDAAGRISGATRSIPRWPLAQMLLERMLLPVPDSHLDAGP